MEIRISGLRPGQSVTVRGMETGIRGPGYVAALGATDAVIVETDGGARSRGGADQDVVLFAGCRIARGELLVEWLGGERKHERSPAPPEDADGLPTPPPGYRGDE